MKNKREKIIAIAIIGIIIFSGTCVGISAGEEINQKFQHIQPDDQIITNEKFELEAKYSYIRSYPGGGGMFILKMTTKNDFSGHVSLKINADPVLNVELDKYTLDKQSQVAELTIEPNELSELKTYEISITATYKKKTKQMTFIDFFDRIKLPIISYLVNRLLEDITNLFYKDLTKEYLSETETITLEVKMYNWSSDNLPDAIIKRDELIDWLEIEHPELGTFTGENCYAYVTYPVHLIVEHWTFLYDDWEMRICYHVMVPPYDWSMLWLRERSEIEAIFAAKQESNGTTYEIPIEDYPIFYGY
jgi:hypothetical protein